jgi:hypothetical protein
MNANTRSWLCTSTLLSVIACSAHDGTQTRESAGASAAAITQQSAHGARESGMVSISVPQGSSCTLHPTGDTSPPNTLPLYADWQGLVHFYIKRPSVSETKPMSLDCQAGENQVTYPVDLQSSTLFQPATPAQTRASLPVRPALKGDPTVPTQQELRKAGYPLRPDPARSPHLYSTWLAAVSKDTTMVPSNLVADPNPKRVHGNGATTTSYQGPWAGAELNAAGVTYMATEADWTLPFAMSSDSNYQQANLWTGLDGDGMVGGSAVVIQGGIEINTVSFDALSYVPWIEYFDGAPEYAYGASPNANDEVFFLVYAGDSQGNFNVNGGWGWFAYEDITQGTMISGSIQAPPVFQTGGIFLFNGATAEYEMEPGATLQSSGSGWEQLYELSDFGSATITGIAMDSNFIWHDFASDPVVTDQLYGQANATVLSTDQVGITWKGPGSSCVFGGGC